MFYNVENDMTIEEYQQLKWEKETIQQGKTAQHDVQAYINCVEGYARKIRQEVPKIIKGEMLHRIKRKQEKYIGVIGNEE